MKTLLKSLYPTILVIFGVTGDLSRRKLLPALFHLYLYNALPKQFSVIGFSRRDWDDHHFRQEVRQILQQYPGRKKQLLTFLKMFHFQPGLFHEKSSYKKLSEHIKRIDDRWGVCTNTLFHLAVPPEYYPLILKNVSKYGLSNKCGPREGWSRILVEKPFGKDLSTAQKLDAMLGEIFREKQIFRVDHYLAKETTRNILSFRFSNAIFEPVWNRKYIEKVKIRLLEKGDIGSRGKYYDSVGALRDVGQNHILQMLALIAMENPRDLKSDSIRLKRAQAIKSLKKINKNEFKHCIVRGQYLGYTYEPNIRRTSRTETYFKIKTFISNKRWQGVPFYLESGKGLKETRTEIVIYFKTVKPCFCPVDHQEYAHQNILKFRLQPQEGIDIKFWAKKPGLQMDIESKDLSFYYEKNLKFYLTGYEKLLYDAIIGDQTLFSSTQEVLSAWEFITPIVKGWGKLPLHIYKKGSWGPVQSQNL